MRGIWMWADSLYKDSAENIFSLCESLGITDVFFLVKGLSGKTAFAGKTAPRMDDSRDPLKEALKAAHKRNVRLHAWFTSSQDAHYKRLHPESGLCHLKNGRDRDIIGISDKGYSVYMSNVINELLDLYDIDGIHLDYIRYNHLLYGWSESDIERYGSYDADTARLVSLVKRTFYGDESERQIIFDCYREGDKDAIALAKAREDDVFCFAKALVEEAKSKRDDLIVSTALMPEGAYVDKAFSALHYGQSYQRLSEIADLFLPMAYSVAYSKDESWVKAVAENTAKYGVDTCIGLHAYEGATNITLARDIEAVNAATGANGYCLFRYGAFAPVLLYDDNALVKNALSSPITRLDFMCADGVRSFFCLIQIGKEKEFRLGFRPYAIKAFCGENEVCAYCAG